MGVERLANGLKALNAKISEHLVELGADGVDGLGPVSVDIGGTVGQLLVEAVADREEFPDHAGLGEISDVGAFGVGPALVIDKFGLQALQVAGELGNLVIV